MHWIKGFSDVWKLYFESISQQGLEFVESNRISGKKTDKI